MDFPSARHGIGETSSSFPGALRGTTPDPGGPLPGGASPRRRRPPLTARLTLPAVLLLVLLGPGLGAAAWRAAEGYEDERHQEKFGDALAERTSRLKEEVLSFVEVLHSARGLFDSSVEVTREEFSVFTRDARERHPSILAIAWVPRVVASEREAHERRVREDGIPEYRITALGEDGRMAPAPEAAEHYPVTYVEPTAGNERVLGFDELSEPARRRAIEQSLRSRRAAMTDPLVLVRRAEDSPGAILFLGVYARGEGPGEGGEPVGLVAVAFHFAEFFGRLAQAADDGPTRSMALEILDPVAEGRPLLVRVVDGPAAAWEGAPFTADRPLQVAQQEWVVRGTPTPAYLESRSNRDALGLGLAVLGVWWLFAAFLLLLARSTRSHALQRQARAVHLVLRSLGEGVVVADRRGRVVSANAAALRLLGTTLQDLESGDVAARCGILDPVARRPLPEDRLPLARAVHGESVEEVELRVEPPDSASGSWVRANARPLRNEAGAIVGGVMVLRDVTVQKGSEESLERLSRAVEATADGVCITDRDGRILYVNPAFEASTGYPRQEVLGRDCAFLDGSDPERHARSWTAVLRGEVVRETVVNRRKDGETYYAEESITPMKDRAGRVTHSVLVSKDVTERRRLEEQAVEMRVASGVQRRLYPRAAPSVDGLEVAGAVLAAEATCGDYYDYFGLPDGRLGLAIGDVSGHGLGPALVMAETRAYLRALVDAGLEPEEVLRRINTHLCHDLGDGLFVTLCCASVDPRTRRISFVNAGHTAALVFRPDGTLAGRLPAGGPPLGMFDGLDWGEREGPVLEPGGILVFVTDGVTECRSPSGDFFDEAGVVQVVRAHRGECAAEIVDRLQLALFDFGGRRPLCDDVTIVVCKAAAVAE